MTIQQIERDGDIDQISAVFNVFAPELQDDPFPVLHRLRTERPIAHSEIFGGYWILSKYEHIRDVLSNPGVFSSTKPTIPMPPVDITINSIPVQMDAPDHTEYRRILGPLFSPARVAALEETLRASARALIEKMLETPDEIDFLKDFAIPLPCLAILHLLGLPEEDLDLLIEMKNDMLTDQFSPDSAVRQAFVDNRIPEIVAYFTKHIDARRDPSTAPDDFITRIVHAKFADERELTVMEMVNMISLLISAGLDTTTAQLSFFTTYFAENQDRWEELANHPERIPGAVEELLRHNAIVTLARLVTEDIEIGGQKFKAGEQVLLLLSAAAFDEEEFPDARTVDFERRPNRHMTFGGGPHRCLGSSLARLELRIALEELREAVPKFELAGIPRRDFGLIMNTLELRLRIPQ
ncbi:cytochrome P450 [Rhodococcus koreensis]|uniref:cytochrome P450 n=1 Tax=Rhodococcus koreensis TaxID=99653 RepID=UPI003672A1AD